MERHGSWGSGAGSGSGSSPRRKGSRNRFDIEGQQKRVTAAWFHRPLGLEDVRESHFHRHYGVVRSQYNMYENPCYIMPAKSVWRIRAVRLVDNPKFDYAVLIVILLNVVVEVMELPSLRGNSWTRDVTQIADKVFLGLFVVEAVLKVSALGFVMHKWAYLRDAWNVGDFLIVVTGVASQVASDSNLGILRLVRLMRPLRAIRRVRGMRVLVNTLVQALPMMADVLWLMLLVMYIFAVLGIQMWKGIHHKRCFSTSTSPPAYTLVAHDSAVCGSRACEEVAGMAIECAIHNEVYTETVLTFDYIWNAMLLVFKVVTLDDWPADMETVQDASSTTAWIYFVLLTLVGGYFCLNLVLAILAVVYTETQRAKLSAVVSRVVPQAEMPSLLSHAEREVVKVKIVQWRQEVEEKNRLEGKATKKLVRGKMSAEKIMQRIVGMQREEYSRDAAARAELTQEEIDERREAARDEADNTRYIPQRFGPAAFMGVVLLQTVGAVAEPLPLLPIEEDSDASSDAYEPSSGSSYYTDEGDEEEEVEEGGETKKKRRALWWARKPFFVLTHNTYFQYLMLLITLVNVVMMASDHLGAPEKLISTINNTSVIASWCFLFEMLFKVTGLGPKRYFRDGYNSMDFILVLLSIPEIFSLAKNLNAFAAFRAFRGFRLMVRIKPLQKTVSGIAHSVVAVLWLLLLMLLIIFIYAMLGLNLFETTFKPDHRENFRSLWEASITVFVVITGDSWATLMKKAIDGTTGAASIFFVSLFCVGNLMLTNLFIAILIDHFKEGGDEEDEAQSDASPRDTGRLNSIASSREGDSVASPQHLPSDAGELSPAGGRGRKAAQWDQDQVPPGLKARKSSVRFADDDDASARDAAAAVAAAAEEEECEEEEEEGGTEELRQFRKAWGGGWRVSMSTAHGRPYWWREEDVTARRLWVCPQATADQGLTKGEKDRLLLAQEALAAEGQRRAAKDCAQQQHFMAFCPYRPPPGAYTKLMRQRLEEALDEPDAGMLRLFQICATRRTLRSLRKHWGGPAQQKRIFLHHLADAGVMCPMGSPPPFSVMIDAELRAAGEEARADGPDREEPAQAEGTVEAKLRAAAPRSLGFFSRDNVVRRQLAKVVLHKHFDDVVIVLIFINAIFLALDDYYADERPGGRRLLEIANVVFIMLFLLEMAGKVVVLGLWGKRFELHENGRPSQCYLSETWNRVDFVVVLAMLADLLGVPGASKLRCARTLRILVRLEALQVVVRALLRAAPQIVYICIVCCFVWIVFAILGVQLFKGQFHGCNDTAIAAYTDCVGFYLKPNPTALQPNAVVVTKREWTKFRVHFDHIGMALLTLFEVAVVEDWAPIMWRAVDGNGYGFGPVVNAHPERSLFFIVFVVVGNFFCINLFVGTLINRFNSDMETLLTRSQAKDAAYNRLLALYSADYIPIRPSAVIRSHCYTIIHHRHFDTVILCLILLNCAVMGTEHYQQPSFWSSFLTTCDYVFVVLFGLEAVCKMLALGVAGYFREPWNRFDFVCVTTSLIGVVFQSVNTGGFRVLRVARALRIMKRARRLELLFHTMLRSLPSLGNIVLLMCYVFFNWGVVGVEMFKNVKQNSKLGEHSNFRTLPAAVLVLYQIGTTETWTSVMAGTSLSPPECEPELDNCGKTWGNYPYFVSYMIIGSFVFMNLFIFVVLHNFENDRLDIQEQRNDSSRSQLHRGFVLLKKSWIQETERLNAGTKKAGNTNRIDVSAFIEIIQTIPEPVWKRPVRMFLRTPSAVKWLNLIRNIRSLPVQIPLYKPHRHDGQHQVEYSDVLKALAMRVVGLRLEDVYPSAAMLPKGDKDFDLVMYVGALRLLEIWKERNVRREQYLNVKKTLIVAQAMKRFNDALHTKQAKVGLAGMDSRTLQSAVKSIKQHAPTQEGDEGENNPNNQLKILDRIRKFKKKIDTKMAAGQRGGRSDSAQQQEEMTTVNVAEESRGEKKDKKEKREKHKHKHKHKEKEKKEKKPRKEKRKEDEAGTEDPDATSPEPPRNTASYFD